MESGADASFAIEANSAGGNTISTYTVDDPASATAKILVARTHVLPNGDIETLVAERFTDRDSLLAVHRGIVA